MNIQEKPLERRDFLRGAFASILMIPLGVTLASCATGGSTTTTSAPGGKKTEQNPFGLAATSTVDAVIFNGGYGIDYAQFAGQQVQALHKGTTVKVTPQTNIAQTLQPRFVSGNP